MTTEPPLPLAEGEVESLASTEDLAIAEHLASAEPLAAPSVDVVWLQSVVQKASHASGQERRQLADAVNEAFQRIGQTGGSRATADFLLRQLESGLLKDLFD